MILRSALCALGLLALVGCGEQVAQMKDAAVDITKEAAKVASDMVDTKTACTLAGQNEAFCGCLQTELGAKIAPEHIDAVAKVVKDSLGGQGVQKAAESATGIDEKTKSALVKCSVQGAVGAATEAAGQ